MELLNASLIDWSRLQFAMTAMYHWLFVPLTLGLGLIMAIMESIYVKTGNEQWKNTSKFWQKIFGINFAIGVATGIIMEFQFGTNWSNYSYFVGDIFGAPLAIEGIVAFFMEATFIWIIFLCWKRVSKKMHLASTWLVCLGATLSALWILVANAWMQFPTGMEFNPDTVRNEMTDFWAVALSPVAINKFLHTTVSSWIFGAIFVVAIAAWYTLKKRNLVFADQSMKVGAYVGLVACLLTAWTGHGSAYQVAQIQPMKLAAMEGLYEGKEGAGLIAVAVPNPNKKSYDDSEDPFLMKIEIPRALSLLGYNDLDAFVPGIKDIIAGGYTLPDGSTALSFKEKQSRGKAAIAALGDYQKVMTEKKEIDIQLAEAEEKGDIENLAKYTAISSQHATNAEMYKARLKENYPFFGYGYLDTPEQTIPNIPITFWSFHIMVMLGGFFIALFAGLIFFMWRKNLTKQKWMLWITVWSVPLVYICTQAGWVVAEVGRQPWTIQDLLPVQVAISALSPQSVIITIGLFFALFTALLVAEIRIMLNQIKKGPEEETTEEH